MEPSEHPAGPGRLIAVYTPYDTGTEVDVDEVFREIAEDAATRASQGWQLLSMTVVPLRHSAAFIAREGSGYESKISVAVLYGSDRAA